MKPGPATSALATPSAAARIAARPSAMFRGLRPAGLANTMAALVVRSPWVASRGNSTPMRSKSSPAGRSPATTMA